MSKRREMKLVMHMDAMHPRIYRRNHEDRRETLKDAHKRDHVSRVDHSVRSRKVLVWPPMGTEPT